MPPFTETPISSFVFVLPKDIKLATRLQLPWWPRFSGALEPGGGSYWVLNIPSKFRLWFHWPFSDGLKSWRLWAILGPGWLKRMKKTTEACDVIGNDGEWKIRKGQSYCMLIIRNCIQIGRFFQCELWIETIFRILPIWNKYMKYSCVWLFVTGQMWQSLLLFYF